ncbi:MAG: cell division protein ZapA [Acidobacteria bacterium]|nr:cell division protein ZapA [Acidobacteriota bacterium]
MTMSVTVEIAGQRYPIRSTLDPAYVVELAAYVDQKMRTAADAAPSSDTLGLAVLVALNIADEYFRARQQQSSADGEINERALRLERLVDDVLGSVDQRRTADSGV